MDTSVIEDRKARARSWFEALRDDICAAFERLEDDAPASLYPGNAGRFQRTPWDRADHTGEPGGGGVMSICAGGCSRRSACTARPCTANSPRISRAIQGAAEDPHFWASGISLIAHMRNPNVPAVHMNTRFVVTTRPGSAAARPDAGAGAAPQPGGRRYDRVSCRAEGRLRRASAIAPYEKYKKWCDEYFYLPHREEPRGIGGIFYDHHDSGDWDADFAFTRDVGRAFLNVYPRSCPTHFARNGRPRSAKSS